MHKLRRSTKMPPLLGAAQLAWVRRAFTCKQLPGCVFYRVLNIPGFLMHLAFGLIHLAFGLHLLLTGHLSKRILHRALGFRVGAFHMFTIHVPSPREICRYLYNALILPSFRGCDF